MTAGLQNFEEASVTRAIKLWLLIALCGWFARETLHAQVIATGAGAYTKTLPAGAAEPQAKIYTTLSGPVRTHQYWSSKLWTPLNSGGGFNIVPQPLFTSVFPDGLSVGIHGNLDGYPANDQTAIAFYQYPNFDLKIGNASLSASSVNVSATSDWTSDFTFAPSLTTRTGRGMPFVYALTDGTPVTVTFARTPTILINNKNILAVSTPEGDSNFTNYYGLFCPAGGTWVQNGLVFTCNAPSGSNYMSVALLPGLMSGSNGNQTTIATQLADYTKVAFSFPMDTKVTWAYNEGTSTVSTTYTITTKSMDGTSMGFLSALYPTQYDAMATAVNTPYLYLTNHGTMKINSGTSFTTVDTFHGVLPMLPTSTAIDKAKLKTLVDAAGAPSLQASDYEQGKMFGQAAQLLPLASIADPAVYTSTQKALQTQLQTWYTASTGGSSDLFYYNSNWGTLIGYPASFDSDDQINDHHFHYGYFIHSSAINGLFNPSWIADGQYGGMVRLLQQDIANYDRSNTMFPFLRHFDIYAGHSWASGQAPFSDGENEESSSEAINAYTGMILLGAANGDTALRDAGIWLYTQETKAVAYLWFNEQPAWVNAQAQSIFPSWFAPLRVANQFDDKGDTGTFFGANPDFEHAIEFLPFTGGSLHLGLSPAYVEKNYQEDVAANAAVVPAKPAGDWPDLMAEYEALSNPATALSQFNNVTAATDGDTLAHEYAWITSLQTLGQVNYKITANTPFYSVFTNNGATTHVAFNPSTAAITVTFSDNASLVVPAGTVTSDNAAINPFTFGMGVATVQPPAAPVGLVATAKSSTEIDVAWAQGTGVTYTLYRSTTSGFVPSGANQIATALSTAAYVDTGLAPSTTYYYIVEASNAGGSSTPSAQGSATTSAGSGGGRGGGSSVPEQNQLYLVSGASAGNPSLLTFSAGAPGVDEIPANPNNAIGTVTNPIVYTIAGVSGTYNAAAQTGFAVFVDAGTNPGEGAQMEVTYDFDGTGTNVRTELYNFFPTNAAADYENYNNGQGLTSSTGTFTNMRNGTVTIKLWDALPGVNDAQIALATGNTTGAESNLLIPFTSVTLTAVAPQTPAGLMAMAASSSSVNLSWTASTTGGVTYSLFRSNTTGFTPGASNMIASGLTGTTYSDANLAASTTYYYVVEAVNAVGSSAPSAQAAVTTPVQSGPIAGTDQLFLVAGATASTPSLLSFVPGPGGVDTIPVNNPQSPDIPMNPLVYTITGLNGTYDNTKQTMFDVFVDAGTHVGEGAQVEVYYDLTGSGTYDRTELYHFFGTDPILGYEDYNQGSRGGLETGTGTLGNMINGTIVVKVWQALPGPDAATMSLSSGNAANALSNFVIPFNTITQNPAGPAAPTAIAAVAKSASEIDLSWMPSTTNGVTYNVYRSATAGFKPAAANLLANVTGNTYTDMGLKPASTFSYVVSATNAAGTTAGMQVTATTLSTPSMTSLALSAPSIYLNGTETLTATVAPTAATGSITFKDGSATLGTMPLASSSAGFTTGPLTGGAHSFTAVYSGDAVYAPSTSAPRTLSVPTVPPDFTLSSTPGSVLVAYGSAATYTLNLAPLGNYAGSVSFACAGLPAGASCSFSPATVALNGTAATTDTLTIATGGKASLTVPSLRGGGWNNVALAFLPAGFAVFLFGGRRRKSLRKLMLGSSMLALAFMFSGCNSLVANQKTTISTVTITATSSNSTHTTQVVLDVQQY
jgi:endoglucanase Acf2